MLFDWPSFVLEGKMDLVTLADKAFRRNMADVGALSDAFEVIRMLEKDNFYLAHQYNKEVRRFSAKYAKEQGSARMLEMNKKSLLFDAPYDFDAYCRYIEWTRDPEKRFYLPRRKRLKVVADSLQMLADGNLE